MNFAEAKSGNGPRCVSVDTSNLFNNILLMDSVGSYSTEHMQDEKGAHPKSKRISRGAFESAVCEALVEMSQAHSDTEYTKGTLLPCAHFPFYN